MTEWPGRDSKQVPPYYESRALLIDQIPPHVIVVQKQQLFNISLWNNTWVTFYFNDIWTTTSSTSSMHNDVMTDFVVMLHKVSHIMSSFTEMCLNIKVSKKFICIWALGTFLKVISDTKIQPLPSNAKKTDVKRTFGYVALWSQRSVWYPIGPYILQSLVESPRAITLIFFEHAAMESGVSPNTHLHMSFQNGGVRSHCSCEGRQRLSENQPGRWVGRGLEFPVSWPARSPDLNLIDMCQYSRY